MFDNVTYRTSKPDARTTSGRAPVETTKIDNPAAAVSRAVRTVLAAAGVLDAVVKVNTAEGPATADGQSTWLTDVDMVVSATAVPAAFAALKAAYPGATVRETQYANLKIVRVVRVKADANEQDPDPTSKPVPLNDERSMDERSVLSDRFVTAAKAARRSFTTPACVAEGLDSASGLVWDPRPEEVPVLDALAYLANTAFVTRSPEHAPGEFTPTTSPTFARDLAAASRVISGDVVWKGFDNNPARQFIDMALARIAEHPRTPAVQA